MAQEREVNRSSGRLVLALAALAIALAAPLLHSQTLSVLHNFTGSLDGLYPVAGLTIDSTGNNLYGTTAGLLYSSGPSYGTVFRLRNHNGAWVFSPLYGFTGGNDGAYAISRVVIGPNGTLYGAANRGGGTTGCMQGCGLVFNLHVGPTFPRTPLTPWVEDVLYRFQGGGDGAYPGYGDLVFDQSGNIYGTGSQGGLNNCSGHVGCGVVYTLTLSGGSYTESAVYAFTGGSDGAFPLGAVAFDHSGDIFTTTFNGGNNNNGTVIELTPSGSSWTETTIHLFNGSSDGANPWTGVILDNSGNLYGTTSMNGASSGGTVYELMPSGGSFTFSVLESLTGSGSNPGPRADLASDASGNLYGTNWGGGAHGFGSIFKLTPSGGGYTYTDLYDFTGGSDGSNPASNVVLDSSGNLYGTAYQGGSHSDGVVWELTP